MRLIIFLMLILFPFLSSMVNAQPTQDPAFGQALQSMLQHSIPTITIKDFKKMMKNEKVLILDAREKNEYDVSHIKGAKLIGHNSMDKNVLEGVSKTTTIVLYCTIGVRADKVGARLQKMGYTNLYALLGSIVEWVNQGNEVVDSDNNLTTKVHAYREDYAKWMTAGTKVFDE